MNELLADSYLGFSEISLGSGWLRRMETATKGVQMKSGTPGAAVAAAALATFGAASAIPIPLAQFDFAGLFNVFNIDANDVPRGLLVVAGIGGFLTIGAIALAFVGAALALMSAASARTVLGAAALVGFVTAFLAWLPVGIVLGAAAALAGQTNRDDRPAAVGG